MYKGKSGERGKRKIERARTGRKLWRRKGRPTLRAKGREIRRTERGIE